MKKYFFLITITICFSCKKHEEPVVLTNNPPVSVALPLKIEFDTDSAHYSFTKNDSCEFQSICDLHWINQPALFFRKIFTGVIHHKISTHVTKDEIFTIEFYFKSLKSLHDTISCFNFNQTVDFANLFSNGTRNFQRISNDTSYSYDLQVGFIKSYSGEVWRSVPFYTDDTIPFPQTNPAFKIESASYHANSALGSGLLLHGTFQATLNYGYNNSGITREIRNGTFTLFIKECLNSFYRY